MEIIPAIMGLLLCGIGAMIMGLGIIRGFINIALPTGILKQCEYKVIFSKMVSSIMCGMLTLAGGALFLILYAAIR